MPDDATPPAGDGTPPPAGDDSAVFSTDERAEIVALVRDAVRDSVVALLGNDDDDDTPPAGDGDGGGTGAGGRADLEGATEDAVRRAMGRIERDKELSGRIERVEKLVTEEAPREVRRLTSFLWGSSDG